MSLTPDDREVLEAYQATEQARLRPDPDPLDPTDVDLAYAEGWTDGQDDVARRPKARSVPISLVIEVVAFTFGIGFIFGLVFASAVHAAPWPPAVIPPTGSPAVQADQLATGVPPARALGGAPSPLAGVPSPRPNGGIGKPACEPAPCPTATPRPEPKRTKAPRHVGNVRHGTASTYGDGYRGWTAIPEGAGFWIRICGVGGCRERLTNDAGPNLAMQRAGRIVDLDVPTFEAVCGVANWRTIGLCDVTVEVLR